VPAGLNFLVPRATWEGRATAKAETKTAAAYFRGPECIRNPATAEGGPEDLEPVAGKKLPATRLSTLFLQISKAAKAPEISKLLVFVTADDRRPDT